MRFRNRKSKKVFGSKVAKILGVSKKLYSTGKKPEKFLRLKETL